MSHLKTCTKCHQQKLEKYFYLTGTGRRRSTCKECDKSTQNAKKKPKPKRKSIIRDNAYYARIENAKRTKLAKEQAKEDKAQCRYCTMLVEKEEIYLDGVCEDCFKRFGNKVVRFIERDDLTSKTKRV